MKSSLMDGLVPILLLCVAHVFGENEGDIRIIPDSNFLEVFHAGGWGKWCVDGREFVYSIAQFVCRSLDLFYYRHFYGSADGPIALAYGFDCFQDGSNPENLTECHDLVWGDRGCSTETIKLYCVDIGNFMSSHEYRHALGAKPFPDTENLMVCGWKCVDYRQVYGEDCTGMDWNAEASPYQGSRCWIHTGFPIEIVPTEHGNNVTHYEPFF